MFPMNYACYQEAYEALVKENDGVLPDLYELAEFTVANEPELWQAPLTVADVVAMALVEVSEEFSAANWWR
ncbi:MAG: hypothetical protein ACRYFV_02860 [Janthinobacterium lividum]|jgi:hypothetical protein